MSDLSIDTTGTAIVARRADPGDDPDPEEIRALAEAAGFDVVAAVTQTRPEDPGTNLGAGKVEELAALAEERDADAVVIDDQLTPAQTFELGERLPHGTAVIDRYRLVLSVFAEQAGDERATLQVELARLQYELPRIEVASDGQFFNKFTEKGTWLHHAEDRIEELQRKLSELSDVAAEHRERRREQGFDLVAIAGYTNAGKSTLLHRLADDLSLDSADPDHPDETATAAIEDRLFKTLETTTRRSTIDGREVMLTDTVGFVDDLPHDLVRSFSATLDEVAAADAVVLVADASDDPDDFRSKLSTSLSVVEEAGGDPGDVVVALNKADLLDENLDPADGDLADRRAAVPDDVAAVVTTSVTEGTGVEELRERVLDALPVERAVVSLPNDGSAMGLVSRIHDATTVEEVEYGDRVRVAFEARPEVVERLLGRAEDAGGRGRVIDDPVPAGADG